MRRLPLLYPVVNPDAVEGFNYFPYKGFESDAPEDYICPPREYTSNGYIDYACYKRTINEIRSGDYFGVPQKYLTWDYWDSVAGFDVFKFFSTYNNTWSFAKNGVGGVSINLLNIRSFIVPVNDTESIAEKRDYVASKNKELIEYIYNVLKIRADFMSTSGDAQFYLSHEKVAQIRGRDMTTDFLMVTRDGSRNGVLRTESINIAPVLADALFSFVNDYRRMPNVIFSDYKGDTRLPYPNFESDAEGILCPTYAAISILAFCVRGGFPAGSILKFTDTGPRFLDFYNYDRFRVHFWNCVSRSTDCYLGLTDVWIDGDSRNRTLREAVGHQLVKVIARDMSTDSPFLIAPADADKFEGGFNGQQFPIMKSVAQTVANTYSAKLREAEDTAQAAASKAINLSFLGAVMSFLSMGAMVEAFGSVLNGSYSIQNITGTLKLGQTFKLYDAGDVIGVLGLLNTGGLSQDFIDGLAESPSLIGELEPIDTVPNDASIYAALDVSPDVSAPVIVDVPIVDTLPDMLDNAGNLPDNVGTGANNMDDFTFDDFEYFDEANFGDIETDFGDIDFGDDFFDDGGDFGVDVIETSFDDGFDWAEIGTSDYDLWGDESEWDDFADWDDWDESDDAYWLSFDTPQAVDEMAQSYGDLSLEQFGAIAGSAPGVISKAGALLGQSGGSASSSSTSPKQTAAASSAAKSGDGGILDTLTAGAGALLQLYTQYQIAQKKINPTPAATRPTSITQPTKPGQVVKQPDGSISVMNADGTIKTMRPNGQTVKSTAGAGFTIGGMDGKTLAIGAAVAGMAALLLSGNSNRDN